MCYIIRVLSIVATLVCMAPVVSTRPPALANAGQTCYINTAMQSLYHMPEFVRLVHQLREMYPDEPCVKLLSDTFRDMSTCNVLNKARLSARWQHLRYYLHMPQGAQDASELLSNICAYLYPLVGNNHPALTVQEQHSIYTPHGTLMQRETRDVLQPIHLVIGSPAVHESLPHALKKHYGMQVQQDGCVRDTLLTQVPWYMMIKMLPIMQTVQLSECLVLTACDANSDEGELTILSAGYPQLEIYRLHSLYIYRNGHYWAYVRENGIWWRCNDSSISQQKPQETWNITQDGFPYIVVYQRITDHVS